MKKFIILILIASFMNGCKISHIFNGGKGHGGGHKSFANMRR